MDDPIRRSDALAAGGTCGELGGHLIPVGAIAAIPAVKAVVLPCEVGNVVWVIADADYQHGWKPYVLEAKVTEISWKRNRSGKDLGFAIIVERSGFYKSSNRVSFNSIGKAVFLTKEAAYQRGYEQGKRDAVVHGYWIDRSESGKRLTGGKA